MTIIKTYILFCKNKELSLPNYMSFIPYIVRYYNFKS